MEWYHKYNPETFDDMVLPDSLKKMFQTQILGKNQHKNYIFYSKEAGVGKSSLSNVIKNETQRDILFLHGASGDNGKFTIDNKIPNFASKMHHNGKIIVIDEAHNLSHQAMDSLKNQLDSLKELNTSVILTCNNHSKITEYVKSRMSFIDFDFSNNNEIKKEMAKKCYNKLINICTKENIITDKLTTDEIQKINITLANVVKDKYPSLRNMIKTLQDIYQTNGNLFNYSKSINDKLNLNKIFKTEDFYEVCDYLEKNDTFNSNIYSFVKDNLNLKQNKYIELIKLSSKYATTHETTVDKELNMMSYVCEVFELTRGVL